MMKPMTASEAADGIIRKWERFSSRPYLCPSGVWTIARGHTHDVGPDTPECDEDQADEWYLQDRGEAEVVVNQWVEPQLNQNQFDALVSFVYNVGPGRPDAPGRRGRDGFVWLRRRGPNGEPVHSTLLRKLNASDYDGAADEIPRWVYGPDGVLPGLVTRREEEARLFCS